MIKLIADNHLFTKTPLLYFFALLQLHFVIFNSNAQKPLITFSGHTSFVSCVAISPDNQLLASVCSSRDKISTIKIWNLETGKLVQEFSVHDQALRNLKFSPDGNHLLASGWSLLLWDLRATTNNKRPTFIDQFSIPIDNFSFSNDGKYIVMPYNNKFERWKEIQLYVWKNRTKGLELEHPKGKSYDRTIKNAVFSNNDNFVIGTTTSEIYKWDTSTGKIVQTLHFSSSMISKVLINYDSSVLFVFKEGFNSKVSIWDIKSNLLITDIFLGEATEFQICPSGRHLIYLLNDDSNSCQIIVYDWLKNKKVTNFGKLPRYSSLAISKDGKYIAVSGSNNDIFVWETPSKLFLNIDLYKAKDLKQHIDKTISNFETQIDSLLNFRLSKLMESQGEFETLNQYNYRIQNTEKNKNAIRDVIIENQQNKNDSLKGQYDLIYNRWVDLIANEHTFYIDSLFYIPDEEILKIKVDYTDDFLELPVPINKARNLVPSLRANPFHRVLARFHPSSTDKYIPIIKSLTITNPDSEAESEKISISFR